MSNKNKKRVGAGMKPRVNQQVSAVGEEKPAQEVSASAGQGGAATEAVSGQDEGTERGNTLEPNSVQNLDSEKSAGVAAAVDPEAADRLGALMEKSKLPEFGEVGRGENVETGCISNEELEARVFGFTGFKKLPEAEFTKEGFVDPPQMRVKTAVFDRKVLDTLPRFDVNPHDGEAGMEPSPDGEYVKFGDVLMLGVDLEEMKKAHPLVTPNGFIVGQRPDGTFGLVVSIPEGYIEPIRQQAESDRVTPEEWISTRLIEYLEPWWGAAKSK